MTLDEQDPAQARRGRPPGTSARAVELIAIRLFAEQGFEATTVEEIAAEAGISRRTFFRYFESKSAVLWYQFDGEVERLRETFTQVPDDVELMDAIRQVVVAANVYLAQDAPQLRARMNLLGTAPGAQASAGPHYDAWERTVSEFAARRLGESPDALYPLAIGRATLAVCRAAFDRWVLDADGDLTEYLDLALRALGKGFATDPE
ncbi:mycofactocin system transcriptional regulator [Nocardia sp. NPDC088792]|uniref:mycofactocin system transcriptional regulator n=1 Tax=Nocardia sp. NPDC088792 TaxID=3364332 RepID=UPI00381244C0